MAQFLFKSQSVDYLHQSDRKLLPLDIIEVGRTLSSSTYKPAEFRYLLKKFPK